MGFAHSYADAILNRGRVPMEPATFVPDWTDRPRKWKHYPGLDSYPLPHDAPTRDGREGTLHDGIFGGDRDEPFTLAALGGMLRDCYGLVGRRLAIQSNTDMAGLPAYTHANWHRGAASGGGLYPVTMYWVAGAGGPVLPGVYHYAPHQHALRPLLTGDVSDEVRRAVGGSGHDQFLVLGVKYWQNAFKYNSFCFHAVSMDVGAATQSLRSWARSAGRSLLPHWFFDEQRLADLLGVDGDEEGIFAVFPLRWRDDPVEQPPVAQPPVEPAPGTTRVGHHDMERSRRVLTFDAVQRMHRATLQDRPGSPTPECIAAAAVRPCAAGVPVPLPPPATLPGTMRTALRKRRSSFGRFDARTPVPAPALGAALAAATAAVTDTVQAGPGRDLVGMYAYVNHVDGVAPGTYRYADGRLWLIEPTAPGGFLQQSYFLSNYNLERAGVVVVPTMRTSVLLDAVGDRGYRLVNATIGAVAQSFYLAATALGLGSGVALGFDNVSYVEQLGLSDGEVPLLLMMLGADRPGGADFRYEIA